MRKRMTIYAGAAVLALGALAINSTIVRGLERELQAIADEKIEQFRSEEADETRERMQIGATVVAAKSYVLFGDVSGKIAVYLRHSPDPEARLEGFEILLRARSRDRLDADRERHV